ncbi:ATP-dependent DNA helicase RecG [Prosthecochloris sp. ZM]|nr:ATP-dependent DNA helicase RecG [Prosthecochloris sp. ZM]
MSMLRMNSDSTPLTFVKGVGPEKARVLESEGLGSVRDLYDYFPRRYLDRSRLKAIGSLAEGELVTVVGTVSRAEKERSSSGKALFRVWLSDGTGNLVLTWFRGAVYFSKMVRPGDLLAVHGKVGFFCGHAQMQHPDFDRLQDASAESGAKGVSDADLFHTGRIIPLYPVTDAMKKAGLDSRRLRAIILRAMESHPAFIDEHLPDSIIASHGLLELNLAYRQIHCPVSSEMLERAVHRFKWNELFYAQLFFALRYHAQKKNNAAVRFERSGEKTAFLYSLLPFSMTDAQKQAVREIYRDLKSGSQMNRLLQGDVGSGKTLVAMFSMALAVDNGLQAAIMAPTEILAFQHWLGIRKYCEPLGLRVGLLTGSQKKKERDVILSGIEDGSYDLAVGTHAMIEERVRFKRLGLIIIDEQHRFGVLQRKALQEKSVNPHVLLMTATPIPRTLCMGAFGDLDVTLIDELPGGRKAIVTRLCHENSKPRVLELIRKEVAAGRQAYIVYPLVDESEKIDLKAATDSYLQLQKDLLPELRIGLVHGRMKPAEKELIMDRFRQGDVDVLVGTTVIEVGVDVPNATVMVIEHAERFGLAQLHQLRGRVGRGPEQSYCYLLYSRLGGDAAERLRAMEASTDGFRLSEIDARIRGTGNVLGKEQSGMVSGFSMADLNRDSEILDAAREAAFRLVDDDPQLRNPLHRGIRNYYTTHYHEKFSLADIG